MRQWCGIQLRGPRSVSFVPTANSNTVEMFAVCVCVCVSHYSPAAPLSPKSVSIVFRSGGWDYLTSHSHMECPLPTRCTVRSVRISFRKKKETLILLHFSLPPLVKDGEIRGVFFRLLGEKLLQGATNCTWKNDSPQSLTGIMSSSFFFTCNTRTRRRLHGENVSECCGNRTVVFSLWEECSVSAGCVEECQADHRQSFYYCQLSKINSCKEGLALIFEGFISRMSP